MTKVEETPDAVARSRTFTWEDPVRTAQDVLGRSGIEFLQSLADGKTPPPPMMNTLGMRLASVASGEVVFTLDPAEFHYNPIGSVHGGVHSTMMDSAIGCAVLSLLPSGTPYTSLDLFVRFLAPVTVETGTLTCTGTVLHMGRRTALGQAEIRSSGGKLHATATSSCLILNS